MASIRQIDIENLSRLPSQSGVYLLYGKEGILYIGKAMNVKSRVKNHIQQPNYRDALFASQISRIGYIKTNSEIEALLLEARLIKKYQPKYNVMWKDDKNYFYVAMTKESLPRVFITHQPAIRRHKPQITNHKSQTNHKTQIPKLLNAKRYTLNANYIGPFVDGNALKRTMRLLRRILPYYTQKKHPLLPCSWCHLNLCPGPNPDPKQYRKNIRAIKNILLGKSSAVLKQLKKEMAVASRKQNYEKAAVLRDQIRALENVMENAKILSPLDAVQKLTEWKDVEADLRKILGIKNRISRLEAYDISNIQGQQATGSMVVFVNGEPAKKLYRKFRIRITGKPNDTAMIAETISRRLHHKEWGMPDIMLIDGGKAQLNAAIAVKRQSNKRTKSIIKNIKIVALAKRNEELFIENWKTPILLKNCPQDAAGLFLYLRDEAHRFARAYHHKLRSRIIK